MSSENSSLGRKGVLRLFSRGLMAFFGLISAIFVQRYLGYEAFGMMAFGAAFVGLFGVIGDLGFGIAHNKRVNEKGIDEGKCNGTIITIKSFLSVFYLILVVLGIQMWEFYFGNLFNSQTLEFIVYLYLAKRFVENLVNIFKIIFAAKLKMAQNLIPRIIGRFIQLTLKIAIIVFGAGILTLEESVFYLISAEIFAATLILLLLIHQFWGSPLKKPDIVFVKKYSRFAFPTILIGLIVGLTKNMDYVMLQYFFDSTEVGVFALPQRLAVFLLLISTQTSKLLFPQFSRYYADNKLESINALANKSVKFISITLLPLTTFLFVFADAILISIFGIEASASTNVFQVGLISTYVIAISTPYTIQPVAVGYLRIPMYINIFTLFLNTSLNLIFIPDEFLGHKMMGLGALGAATTTLVSFSTRAIIARYYAYKLTGTVNYSRVWIHFLASIISGIAGSYLMVLGATWYLLLLYFIALTAIFFGILYLFKEFGKEEYMFYSNNLNPYKMIRYIRTELK